MLKNKENESVPVSEFKIIKGDEWSTIKSEDIFSGKKVIVFGLPGAFTPTCSTFHLPRYDELSEQFKLEGIDDIVVVSVNDTFVMNAWELSQGTKNIKFIPDGNGDFTEKMGMLVDKSELGFGKRSWRYSMLVVDGIIEKHFIEPDESGDPFKVSDADTMMAYLNPDKVKKGNVVVFSKSNCPYCVTAKSLLKKNGYTFDEIIVGDTVTIGTLKAISGRKTVPQVFIDGDHIGGSEELEIFLKK